VDITADQFPDQDEPVIVTNASEWHRHIPSSPGRRSARLAFYDGDDHQDEIRGDYVLVKARAGGDRA
jgi:hypothetical protein